MIFEIVSPRKWNPNHTYIKCLHCVDAWDMYNMLENTYDNTDWGFQICSFDGYDNAIVFRNKMETLKLTDSQYNVLLALFNECNEDFWTLPQSTHKAFFDRLYAK